MKTNYKILWIDDNHSTVRGDKKNFERFFKRHGIQLETIEIAVKEGSQTIDSKNFQEAINDIELDIVLVDFNMASGENGNDIIKHIRQTLHHYHLPIIFYSQDGSEKLQKEILKINFDTQDKKNIADGIYFCHRDNIFNKVEKILISLLKKEELPKRARGLLMDRVSEIDAKIIESLHLLSFIKISKTTQEKAQKLIRSKLENKNATIINTIKELEDKNFSELLEYISENYLLFDSSRRAELLREILRELQEEQGKKLSCFYNNQGDKKCLSKLRNDYAHKTELELSENHNPSKCKYIREEARMHLENLEHLIKSEKLNKVTTEMIGESKNQNYISNLNS